MAARLVRSTFAIHSKRLFSSVASKRLFSSVASKRPPLPWFSHSTSSPESFHVVIPGATLLNELHCRVNQYATFISSNFRATFAEKDLQSKGIDFKHWQIAISKSHFEGGTKENVIDLYVKTLAKVLGSEEEARKKIYSVSSDGYFTFGAAVDEETAEKLQKVPGVLFVWPDDYVDREAKDYGGHPVVNGKLVDSPRKVENEDAQLKAQLLKNFYEAHTKVLG